MTTPANRAPKFVVIDRGGTECGIFSTEEDARRKAESDDEAWPTCGPSTVHPIGPALPAPTPVKTLGEVARDASSAGKNWDGIASAVIAAHEAGRETERVVRWAVRLAPGWFGSNFCNANKSERTLFNLREHAEAIAQSFTGARIVRITTRRRRVVKS
jgi:hypothetical protein